MSRIFNVRAKTGEYEIDGVKKDRWTQIGVVLEKNGRKYLKLEAIPVGWDGFASLLEPNDKDGDSQPARGRQQSRGPQRGPQRGAPEPTHTGGGGFDDEDVPFN